MVTVNSKMSLMFESTGHSTLTARRKHIKTDKMHLQRPQKTFLVKSYTILLERSITYIDYIYCTYQFCFRADWSTTKLPWIAVPELYRAQMGTVIF